MNTRRSRSRSQRNVSGKHEAHSGLNCKAGESDRNIEKAFEAKTKESDRHELQSARSRTHSTMNCAAALNREPKIGDPI